MDNGECEQPERTSDAPEPETRPLGAEERLEHAIALAYRYLNRRERTEAEVRGRLARDAVEPPVIEQALRVLRDRGAIDDSRYARMFVQDKRRLEGWGAERIRRALIQRGIDRELTGRILSAGPPRSLSGAIENHGPGETPETELELALMVLRRRFAAPPRDRRERERALGVLLRKGYEPELALEALVAFGRGAPAA
ncbi:MAG: regulatory protein RecX [Solirubrobacteraceae bacterium]